MFRPHERLHTGVALEQSARRAVLRRMLLQLVLPTDERTNDACCERVRSSLPREGLLAAVLLTLVRFDI